MTDLELLALEIETLWECDSLGRLRSSAAVAKPPFVVIATGPGGYLLRLGAQLPDALSAAIVRTVDGTPPGDDFRAGPPALARIRSLLDESGIDASFESGPSYFVSERFDFEADTALVTSSANIREREQLRAPVEANWPDDEWRELLAGELGPWAMAIDGDDVAAICHSARLTARAAEAGVWTHPGHRRKGHAVSTTAGWANLVRESGRAAFYSTSADNLASQGVAARLRLRPIGWLWSFRPLDSAPADEPQTPAGG